MSYPNKKGTILVVPLKFSSDTRDHVTVDRNRMNTHVSLPVYRR